MFVDNQKLEIKVLPLDDYVAEIFWKLGQFSFPCELLIHMQVHDVLFFAGFNYVGFRIVLDGVE